MLHIHFIIYPKVLKRGCVRLHTCWFMEVAREVGVGIGLLLFYGKRAFV
jgi:hypothetical protein